MATGLFVPEFLVDHPEVLRSLHYDFVRAGSDVTEAYQVICFDHKSVDRCFILRRATAIGHFCKV